MAESLLLEPPDIRLHERFLAPAEADRLLEELLGTIAWRQDSMTIYGKAVKLPRLTAWYGDPGARYVYSGIENEPLAWTEALTEIRRRAEKLAGATFNSVLLNLYRGSDDSMGWHSDDERGMAPVIASVSLGATRTFQLRRKAPPHDLVRYRLGHGSLLVMFGQTQRLWQHRVPREPAAAPRINLTFRRVAVESPAEAADGR